MSATGHVLITGATGFVGRRLVGESLAAGRSVTAATRRPDPAFDPHPKLRQVPAGEIHGGTDWTEALRGVGAVLHLAGRVHVAPERAEAEAELFDAVNRAGALRLYEQAAAAGASTFLFVSTIAVLGASTGPGRAFDERSRPAPETVYARSKLAAEEALAARAATGGPVLVVLRPPLIAGPGVKGNLASLMRLAALPLPLPLGGIRNRRTLLSLDNLALAIAAVLDHPDPPAIAGRYCLGDREPVSTTEIVMALRAGLGRPAMLLPAPRRLAGLLARGVGRAGVHDRLFGSLEVDSGAFRRAVGFVDVTDTRTALVRAAAASDRATRAVPKAARL